MNRTRVIFFAFLLTALLTVGLGALVVLRRDPQAQMLYSADMSPTAIVQFSDEWIMTLTQQAKFANVTIPTPSVTQAPCAWSWASRDEVAFSEDLTAKLSETDVLSTAPSLVVRTFSRGENCNTDQGTPSYHAMDTQINIILRLPPEILVNNMDMAYRALEPYSLAILETLVAYPCDTPSFQIALTVEIRTKATYGEAVYIFSTDRIGYLTALEQPGTGIAFFDQLGGLQTTPVIQVT